MTVRQQEIRHREALRYLNNAKEILRTKATKREGYYTDPKYVKMACGTAYSGVLYALDTYLELKGKNLKTKTNRRNIDDYRRALSSERVMLNRLNDTWDVLHCCGYYDGNLNAKLINTGLESADFIVEAIAPPSLEKSK